VRATRSNIAGINRGAPFSRAALSSGQRLLAFDERGVESSTISSMSGFTHIASTQAKSFNLARTGPKSDPARLFCTSDGWSWLPPLFALCVVGGSHLLQLCTLPARLVLLDCRHQLVRFLEDFG